ncbi:MAG: leucyl aminopeptidase [Variovorax sp.]
MDFQLESSGLAEAAQARVDALVVLVPEALSDAPDPLTQLIVAARADGALQDKPGKLLQLYRAPGISAPRLLLAALGTGSAADVRKAVAAATGALKDAKAKSLLLVFAAVCDSAAVGAAVRATGDASYVYTTTKAKADKRSLRRVTIGVPQATPLLREALTRAAAAVGGIELAKEWANRPANHCTPTRLAEAAKELAGPHLKVDVHGPREVAALGMGAFMAVAQGSAEPLRFIELRYRGSDDKKDAPVVLVGKGITFDTGGVSLKPAAEMDEMKFDMCGAASVLGVFRALAELKPAINVIGLIPSCENMNDGKAVKPGDVVTAMDGQTIEVLNTDAEGRLILADALTYAKRFEPAAVIDIATLTGACVVALGAVRSGLFASDDALADALQQAGDEAQDLCWRMPLDAEYAEGLKSNFADVPNIAGRAGGAITAAKFLQRFVGEMPWAHLDIAGTAWKGGTAKGATGRPVALLLSYLLARAAGTSGPKSRPTSRAISQLISQPISRTLASKGDAVAPARRRASGKKKAA